MSPDYCETSEPSATGQPARSQSIDALLSSFLRAGDRAEADVYLELLICEHICLQERATDFGGAKVVFCTGQPADGRVKAGATQVGTDLEIKNDEGPTKPVLTVMAPNDCNKPLLRLGQSLFFYDLKRDANGYLSFTGTQGQPYQGYRFDAPVQLPTFDHANLPTGTVSNGALIYCSNCLRNSAPCREGGTGGAPATVINGVWECK